MSDDRGTTRPGSRPDAASMIAELWAEREQKLAAPRPDAPPPGRKGASRAPRVPGPKAGGAERALGTLIVLLLVGAGLGIGAKAVGLVGAPSKSSYVAKADAICAPANAGLTVIAKPTGYASVTTATSTFVTATDAQLVQLRALELPGGGARGGARSVLSAISATSDATRGLQAATAAGDPAQTVVASRTMTLYSQDAVAKARAYGFTTCVSGMQPAVDAVLAGANCAVKTSLLENGNAICMESAKAGDAVRPIRNVNDADRFFNEQTAIVSKMVADLKALPVPPGDEATVAAAITSLENLMGKVRELISAAKAGDVKRVSAIEKEGDAIEVDANAKFNAYGLTACG